jgi:hypothetical protein
MTAKAPLTIALPTPGKKLPIIPMVALGSALVAVSSELIAVLYAASENVENSAGAGTYMESSSIPLGKEPSPDEADERITELLLYSYMKNFNQSGILCCSAVEAG